MIIRKHLNWLAVVTGCALLGAYSAHAQTGGGGGGGGQCQQGGGGAGGMGGGGMRGGPMAAGGMGGGGGGQAGAASLQQSIDPRGMFDSMDANGDGLLTFEEFSDAMTAGQQQFGRGPMQGAGQMGGGMCRGGQQGGAPPDDTTTTGATTGDQSQFSIITP